MEILKTATKIKLMKQIPNIFVYQTLPRVIFFSKHKLAKTFRIYTIQNSYIFKGQKVLKKTCNCYFHVTSAGAS